MELRNYLPVISYIQSCVQGDTVINANNFKGNILDINYVTMLVEELDGCGNSMNVFTTKLTIDEYFSLHTYKYRITGGVMNQPIVIRCLESARRPIVKALREKYKNVGELKSVRPNLEDYQPILVDGKVTKIYQLNNKQLVLCLNDFTYEVYRLNGSKVVSMILKMISEDLHNLGYTHCGFVVFSDNGKADRKAVYRYKNYTVLIGKKELQKLLDTNEIYLSLIEGDIL